MRFLMFIALIVMKMASCREYCGGSRNGKKLQYVIGDAMTDSSDCLGPDGTPYPMYVLYEYRSITKIYFQSKLQLADFDIGVILHDISELKCDRYCLD